jgi:hypothetical protein
VSLFSRIFAGLGAFLIVTGVIYGSAVSEYEGFTLMIIVGGGALLIGVYLISAVQRARAVLARPETAVGAAAEEGEPHVAPTIWPLVFALSSIGLVVGAVAARWVLVVGGVLLVVAGFGWILDVRRQWRHHAGAAAHEMTREQAGGPPSG